MKTPKLDALHIELIEACMNLIHRNTTIVHMRDRIWVYDMDKLNVPFSTRLVLRNVGVAEHAIIDEQSTRFTLDWDKLAALKNAVRERENE